MHTLDLLFKPLDLPENMSTLKNILLMLALCSVNNTIQAQSFAPLGAGWYYGSGGFGEAHGAAYYRYHAEKDTIVAERSCTKISRKAYNNSGDSTSLYPYFVYQSNDTVFYYNHYHSQFFPLYFFNVQAGDTLTFYQPEPIPPSYDLETWQCVVDSVTTFIVGGDTLKRIVTHDMEPIYATYSFHGGYTEKFGCRRMMLPTTFNIIFEGDGGLRCYSDRIIAHNFTTKPCDYKGPFPGKVGQEGIDFSISPNPAKDYLNIAANSPIPVQYRVFNITGHQIASGSFQDRAYISLADFPAGYYTMKLHNELGDQSIGFIVQ